MFWKLTKGFCLMTLYELIGAEWASEAPIVANFAHFRNSRNSDKTIEVMGKIQINNFLNKCFINVDFGSQKLK